MKGWLIAIDHTNTNTAQGLGVGDFMPIYIFCIYIYIYIRLCVDVYACSVFGIHTRYTC